MKKKAAIILILIIMLSFAVSLAAFLIGPDAIYKTIPFLNRPKYAGITANPANTNESETPISYQSYINTTAEQKAENAKIDFEIAKLTTLYKYVQKNFLWEIDHDAVYEAMATALFNTLGDQYSYYVKSNNAESYAEETSGKYGGLGFYFSKSFVKYQNPEDESTLYCNISQVFPNTPSARGGMKSGDMITKINGQSVVEMESTDCSKLMKGEAGTSVTITILRNGTSFDLSLIREIITVPTIEYTMIDDSMAYLLILQFSPDTVNVVSQALENLKKQGMKTLILDLRNNPGGDVDVALNIANYFINDSDLLTINYKDKSKNTTYRANSSCLVDKDVRVVVLINGGTASSAEILSSTLRDNNRAILVGTKSYGKGIMQIISSFGDGYASITTAEFLPPSGNEIHKKGVEPDIVIEGIELKENEADAYKALAESKIIDDFIKIHPEYTKENVELFVESHPDTGLSPDFLRITVRNSYLLEMNYEDRPKVDTWFDPQLIKAIEVLSAK